MNLLRATGVLAVGLLGLFLVHPAPGASQATTSCEDVDFESPFETVLLCAQQGHAFAQYNLGLRYDTGDGVPEDLVLAYMWFNLSAAQGHEIAQARKERIVARMTRGQIAEARRMLREWMEARPPGGN